jgi:exodeoxyribonuclease V alpha subunit
MADKMDPMELAFRADRDRALADARVEDWRYASFIFADWLEERGRQEEADALRAEADPENEALPERPSNWPNVSSLKDLTPHQCEQLALALRRPVGILAGIPGSGKTYTVASLLRALPAEQTCVCAPTGKAAVRIGEAIDAAGIRNLAAHTIHQTLGIGRNGHDGGGWGFIHNRRNPMSHRFVVVEEASMLDAPLAADLLQACRRGTHVLFIGDPDQLPPVGHGAPLRDWINSGLVPVGRLSEVHRNAGAIAEACRNIRIGEPQDAIDCAWGLTPSQARDYLRDFPSIPNPDHNWIHVHTSSAADTISTLRGLLPAWSPQFPGLFAEHGMDPRVQILAPLREKGPLSCAAVNTHAQDVLNAPSQYDEVKAWGTVVRPGDRIVCTANHLAPAVPGPERVYVANGECGFVGSTRATGRGGSRAISGIFETPPREVILQTQGDEDLFALGYCLTVHKSQGSEWPVVVVVIDDSWGGQSVMGREWIYTALSRARCLCITIGNLARVRQAIASPALEARKTLLAEQIVDNVQWVLKNRAEANADGNQSQAG